MITKRTIIPPSRKLCLTLSILRENLWNLAQPIITKTELTILSFPSLILFSKNNIYLPFDKKTKLPNIEFQINFSTFITPH